MLESWKSIPATDGKHIYYIETLSGSVKSDKAIIIGHGLTGHPQEYMHQIATRYFVGQDYDVYRIGFYGDPKDARKLPECTLAIHASDLNQLVAHVSPNYKKTFVAGHSYGGLTLLIANPAVDAIAFWDSSYVPEFWDQAIYIPETDKYVIGWGVYSLIGKAMFEEAKLYTRDYSKSLAAKVKTPSLVALAKLGRENNDEAALYNDLACEKQLAEFAGASHCFYEEHATESLMRETEEFFSKY